MKSVLEYALKIIGVNPVSVKRILIAAAGVLAVALAAVNYVISNFPQ
jgi:hypothetical protein